MLYPVYAQRETKCNYCPEPIKTGERRLDTTTRNRNNSKLLRIHYHYKCVLQKWNEFFTNPENAKVQKGHGGRRASLDLNDEQKAERKKWLTRLSSHNKYYLPKISHMVGKPTADLAPIELKQLQTYYERRNVILEALDTLGGRPTKYANISTPDVLEN